MTELEELTLFDLNADEDFVIGTQEDFPRLKRLETRYTYFSWSSPIYWSLRSLKLFSPNVRPTVVELLHILRGCTELETLELHKALPLSVAANSFFVAVPISLPVLRYLAVGGHHSEVSLFPTLIEVPRSCNIDVHHIMLESDEGSLDPILAVIPTQPLFQSLVHESTNLSLQTDYQEINLLTSCSTHRPRLRNRLTGTFKGNPDLTPQNWKACIDAFSHTPLTHLTLTHNSLQLVTSEMWQMCFSCFPQLESLAVGPWCIRTLRTSASDLYIFKTVLAALQESDPLGTDLYCPRLRAVEITRMVIDAACADAVLAMLEARASGGAPLQELSFEHAYCVREIDALALKARITKLTRLTPNPDTPHPTPVPRGSRTFSTCSRSFPSPPR
ncbi:hypothetical protein C8Q76DRAFT_75074 [Earliella scabrosa]|nr:hypothetical protein C8Q76DRAFT_75074 [Earliella scabrosa]